MPEYRVALRHTTLASAVTLQSVDDDRYFIPSKTPPPAHSILTLHQVVDGADDRADDEDAAVQYFLVDRAIESDTPEQASGIIGRLTDAEAHEQASQLGSEHLEDGEAFVDEGGAPQMAVPSPVVDPDPSGVVDPDERARLEQTEDEAAALEAAATEAATTEDVGQGPPPQADDDAAQAAAADAAPESNAENGEEKPAGRRRKRRGRKRR